MGGEVGKKKISIQYLGTSNSIDPKYNNKMSHFK